MVFVSFVKRPSTTVKFKTKFILGISISEQLILVLKFNLTLHVKLLQKFYPDLFGRLERLLKL